LSNYVKRSPIGGCPIIAAETAAEAKRIEAQNAAERERSGREQDQADVAAEYWSNAYITSRQRTARGSDGELAR
jgi:hypothetical protein